MADPDRRGEHRATVFEQKGEVGGHRRSEGEDQSGDHDKRPAKDAVLVHGAARSSRA
jgi:hypothetical protein